jgi:hypothetical protein
MADCKITLPFTNGPSKLKLLRALGESDPNGEDHPLAFTLKSGREIKLILRGLTMEDGSHEKWLIQGYSVEEEVWKPIKGYLNTLTGEGHLEYISRAPHLSSIPKPSESLNKLFPSDKIISKNNLEKIKLDPVIDKNTPLKSP